MSENVKVKLQTQLRTYENLLPPEGFLVDDPACYALFYYACLIRSQLRTVADDVRYEGDEPILMGDKRQLFTSVAMLYGVTPERMVSFWKQVDLTFDLAFDKSARVPAPYRFDQVPEIKTQ